MKTINITERQRLKLWLALRRATDKTKDRINALEKRLNEGKIYGKEHEDALIRSLRQEQENLREFDELQEWIR